MKNFLKFSLLIGSSFFIILYPCSDAVSASLGAAAMAAALSGAKDARPKTLVDSPAGPFVGGALAHLPPLPLLDSSAKRSPRSGSAPAGGSGSLHSSHSDGGDGGARARASTMPSAAAAALFREKVVVRRKTDYWWPNKEDHIKTVGHEGKVKVMADSEKIAKDAAIVTFEHEWQVSLYYFRKMNDFLEDFFFPCIEQGKRSMPGFFEKVARYLNSYHKKELFDLGGCYTFAFLIYAHAVNRYKLVDGIHVHADDDYRVSCFAKIKASSGERYGEDIRSWNRVKAFLRLFAQRFLDGANFFDTEAEKALTPMPVIIKTPECPVCMEEINHKANSTGTFSCKHEFCVACVEEFVKKVPATCPLCRGAISAATCKIKPYEVA